ncbi:MAG: propionyl-CoA carboxylase beta chain, partial [Thermoplasmata archaeon]|nr:propionyl-CoA carboxylase beta chain [Thermoplasmata archaeon]
MDDLRRRKADSLQGGGPERIERQHQAGKYTARERVDLLLDAGSFVELDALRQHDSHDFGMETKHFLGDGVVTGWGTVEGRLVYVFAQDFTVLGGSLGGVYAEKICKVMDLAVQNGAPLVGLNDSGGARIQEGVVSLASYGEVFARNVQSSGVVPQISVIMGPCAGGAVYSPAMTDFIFMVKETSHMFITGPDVIKTVTGEDVPFEELGGGRTHNTRSGNAHYLATDEEDGIDYVKTLLSYLPSNNLEDPPTYPVESDLSISDEDYELDTLMPDSPN